MRPATQSCRRPPETQVRVTVLGTGTAIAHADRGPASVLVELDGTALLVDAGSGTLQRLARANHSVLTLDALLLTHAHLDHIADVLPIVFSFVVPAMRRAAPLPIVGSARTLDFVKAALAVFGDWLDGRGQIEFRTVAPGDRLQIGTLAIETGSVEHDPGSIAYRFAPRVDGRPLVAVPGDSGPCDGLVESMRDADLAVIECGVSDDNPVDGHLTPRTLADAAARARVRRIAVVHRYPPLLFDDTVAEQIRDAGFGGDIVVPDDLDVFEVG